MCAASLVLAAFPSIPRAEDGLDPAEAMRFFERTGVVSGPSDVLRSYLTTGSRLTPIGVALYQTLRSRYNAAEAVTAMRPSFDRLRQAGPYNDAQRAATERTIAAFRGRFGDITARAQEAGGAEDTFQWGTLTEALMTGLATAEQQGEPQYQQVALADGSGTEFWDPPDTCRRNQEAARAQARARNVPYTDPGLRDCLAFRMNQNRVLTYNRQLRDNQRIMNADRPRQVPLIPETGHYNVEMFQYGYWKLRNQYDDILQSLNVESMVLMASLMGEQIREVRYYLEPGLRQQLENRAKTHFRQHRGRRWSIYDIVQQRMRARRGYLEGALTAIGEYQSRMNAITSAESISNALVDSLGNNEKVAMRWLTLAVLATQEYAVATQLEALDPSSPDSVMVRAALEASPFSQGLRDRYGEQSVVMRDRMLAVRRVLQGVRAALLSPDYMANLDMIQAGLSSAQRELTEVSADYSIYVEAPSSAYSAATESGQNWFSNGQLHAPWGEGWNVGNWGVGVFASVSETFGFEHGANVRRVGEQVPQYDCIARAVAGERRLPTHCVLPLTRGLHNPAVVITANSSWADVARLAATLGPEHCLSQVVNRGGMAAARCLTIAMNPDAARRFQEVRLTGGGDTTVTDPLRIASSLRVNREQIASVAKVNSWVRAGTSFVTWTVALALAAPLAGWVLRGAVGALSRVPVLSEPLLHFESRLLSVKVAPEFLGSSNPAMRALGAFGWRTASIGGRQAVFTGFSGGVSAGMTSIQHQWMGADSPFENAADAAWQGFEGGVIWSNDSFHPMLGYIGMPSSAFRGMGAVSSGVESVAMRGVTGNVAALVDVASRGIFRRAIFFGETSVMSQASRFLAPAFTQTGAALTRVLPPFVVTAGRAVGGVASFTVASADQLAKYVLLSKAVGYAARELTYNGGLEGSVLPAAEGETEEMRLDREALETERRIKTATAAGHSWEASPIWLLMPVAPAQQMLAANQHRRAMETVKLYAERDATGRSRIAEIANLTDEAIVQIPGGRIKVPLAQTVFELAFKTEQNSANVRMTPAARMEAIRLAVDEAAGVVKENYRGVNPKVFYDITRMTESSPPLRNGLRVNEEVIAVAREKMARTFIENPELTRRFFNTPDGQLVEGFGLKTYFERYEVARALRTASRNLEGVSVPREILDLIEPVNKRAVDSAGLTRPFAETFAKRVHEFRSRRGLFGRVPGKKSQAVAEEALFLAESVARWREGKHPLRDPNAIEADLAVFTPEQIAVAIKDYNRLLDLWGARLKARLNRGQLAADEFALFDDLLNLVRAEERRFNSYNNVETVKAIREELMSSLRNQYASRPHIQEILNAWDKIYGAHTFPSSGRVSQPGVKGPWEQTVAKMEEVLQKNTRVTEAERTSLLRHLTEMRGASWAIKDKSGNALPGWRPEQFEALITTLAMYVEEGQGGREVQIFQMLKTGGGKTLLNFEGLLPLVEADAAIRGLKVLFLTVSKGLEAQAKNDFTSYGTESKIEFNTYEGLKGEIVEGKMAGRNSRRKYWILGDELDGAALQPATTVGEQIGSLTRTSSSHRRHEEIDLTIEARIQARDAALMTGLAQEARQVRLEAQRIDAADVAPIVRAADDLVQATEKLRRAVGPEPVAEARADVATALRRLRESTADLGATAGDSLQAVRRSMTEIERLTSSPPSPAVDRNLVRDVWRFVSRQANLSQLTGSETSVIASVRAARARRMAGERNMERRHDEIQAAELENAQARAEIEVVRQETAQANRFETAEPGVTLVKVAERSAAPGQSMTPATWQPIRGPTRPGEVLMSARTLSERGANRVQRLEQEIARRDAVIAVKRQELSVLEAETSIASRFESVDAGARIVNLAERVVALEGRAGLKPGSRPGHAEPMLNLAVREMTALREKLTPAQRRSHDEHLALRRKMREADEAVKAAQEARDRNPSDPQLERARQARISERETLRTRAISKVTELTGYSDGASRPLLRLGVAREQLASARARLEAAPARSPERAQAAREIAQLSDEVSTMTGQALRQIREVSREVGEEIAKLVQKAPSGFEGMARRMLRMRRGIMREFGSDVSPIVRELEVIRERAEPYSRDPELFSEKPDVAAAALRRLER
ncbi:MAG: hypothetical protein SF051_16315, partial [Elusimicrobiota bacterium]|nr:hypothetical protein [Elusimicrobiota bacterium]